MNSVINRTLEMFARVLAFADERAGAFPADSLAGQAIAELKSITETLNEAATSQNSAFSSARRATANRRAAREALREDMQLLTRTSRVVALDVPTIDARFRLPRSGSDLTLLQIGRAFAEAAEEFKEHFMRYEIPATFFTGFKQKIANLEQAMGEQNVGRGAHVLATATAEAEAERGMNAVRKLDAIVRNKFREDPATLAAWESARRVENPTHARRRTNGNGNAGNSGNGNNA
ncbi:MAG TPA: hypothetical protein VF736_09950 [Pyrinomonadaceae bacterium]|jgi:hypothetical protein